MADAHSPKGKRPETYEVTLSQYSVYKTVRLRAMTELRIEEQFFDMAVGNHLISNFDSLANFKGCPLEIKRYPLANFDKFLHVHFKLGNQVRPAFLSALDPSEVLKLFREIFGHGTTLEKGDSSRGLVAQLPGKNEPVSLWSLELKELKRQYKSGVIITIMSSGDSFKMTQEQEKLRSSSEISKSYVYSTRPDAKKGVQSETKKKEHSQELDYEKPKEKKRIERDESPREKNKEAGAKKEKDDWDYEKQRDYGKRKEHYGEPKEKEKESWNSKGYDGKQRGSDDSLEWSMEFGKTKNSGSKGRKNSRDSGNGKDESSKSYGRKSKENNDSRDDGKPKNSGLKDSRENSRDYGKNSKNSGSKGRKDSRENSRDYGKPKNSGSKGRKDSRENSRDYGKNSKNSGLKHSRENSRDYGRSNEKNKKSGNFGNPKDKNSRENSRDNGKPKNSESKTRKDSRDNSREDGGKAKSNDSRENSRDYGKPKNSGSKGRKNVSRENSRDSGSNNRNPSKSKKGLNDRDEKPKASDPRGSLNNSDYEKTKEPKSKAKDNSMGSGPQKDNGQSKLRDSSSPEKPKDNSVKKDNPVEAWSQSSPKNSKREKSEGDKRGSSGAKDKGDLELQMSHLLDSKLNKMLEPILSELRHQSQSIEELRHSFIGFKRPDYFDSPTKADFLNLEKKVNYLLDECRENQRKIGPLIDKIQKETKNDKEPKKETAGSEKYSSQFEKEPTKSSKKYEKDPSDAKASSKNEKELSSKKKSFEESPTKDYLYSPMKPSKEDKAEKNSSTGSLLKPSKNENEKKDSFKEKEAQNDKVDFPEARLFNFQRCFLFREIPKAFTGENCLAGRGISVSHEEGSYLVLSGNGDLSHRKGDSDDVIFQKKLDLGWEDHLNTVSFSPFGKSFVVIGNGAKIILVFDRRGDLKKSYNYCREDCVIQATTWFDEETIIAGYPIAPIQLTESFLLLFLGLLHCFREYLKSQTAPTKESRTKLKLTSQRTLLIKSRSSREKHRVPVLKMGSTARNSRVL